MTQYDIRQPTAIAAINGAEIGDIESVSVFADRYLGANRFDIRAALTNENLALFASAPAIAEVSICLAGTPSPLILGAVDCLDIDPIRHEMYVEGRDLTSRFLSTQLQQTFENNTASEVISTLAANHGMDADVTPTSTRVGRYFGNARTTSSFFQHSRVTSEWDTMITLAQNEGFDLWIDRSTVRFHPAATLGPRTDLTPNDCIELKLQRRLDIAAGVAIEVKSWNCQQQQIVSESLNSNSNSNSGLKLVFVKPNFSNSDAQAMALRTMRQLAAHERVITFTLPGRPDIAPRTQIQLRATGTDFDGAYEITEVESCYAVETGFVSYCQARRPAWTDSSIS